MKKGPISIGDALNNTGVSGSLRLTGVRGLVLGVGVIRGYARLCDLSNISAPDVFDQKSNPTGTQRDLSQKHAREAYVYVAENDLAFWPEVFLCVRNSDVFRFSEIDGNFGYAEIDLQKIVGAPQQIHISRVDGNHRLHYAGGRYEGFPAIEREVSFCLAYNLELQDEIALFRDINNNQKRMNTSHLDNIALRLSKEEEQKRRDPELYIAKRLGDDPESPLAGLVYEGGVKPAYFSVPLRTLKSGIRYMLTQQGKLAELPEIDAQYEVIKNYFKALREWEPDAWREPKDFLMLRGAGLWASCFIGATVIDRVLSKGEFSKKAMMEVLSSGPKWDWSKKGDFQGLSGRGGAVRIRDLVVREFSDDSSVSINSLAKKILK